MLLTLPAAFLLLGGQFLALGDNSRVAEGIAGTASGDAPTVGLGPVPGYAGKAADKPFSYMKNRWVLLRKGDQICYGQVQDAGPNVYDDAAYVFGDGDPRPANTKFNGAGLGVSPALKAA